MKGLFLFQRLVIMKISEFDRSSLEDLNYHWPEVVLPGSDASGINLCFVLNVVVEGKNYETTLSLSRFTDKHYGNMVFGKDFQRETLGWLRCFWIS